MADKTAAHAEKGSAAVRKPLNEARGSLRPAPAHPATALTRAMNNPASALTASDLLLLQRTAGNRAVAALLAHGNPTEAPRGGRPHGLTLQAKLTVGATNDSYEREADRVAAEVVQRSEP